jgi:hypothetical protein
MRLLHPVELPIQFSIAKAKMPPKKRTWDSAITRHYRVLPKAVSPYHKIYSKTLYPMVA